MSAGTTAMLVLANATASIVTHFTFWEKIMRAETGAVARDITGDALGNLTSDSLLIVMQRCCNFMVQPVCSRRFVEAVEFSHCIVLANHIPKHFPISPENRIVFIVVACKNLQGFHPDFICVPGLGILTS